MTARPNTSIVTVGWDAIHGDLRALAQRLTEKNTEHDCWQGIVAVTRGGLVPAAILARELDIRLIETVCITSYQGTTPGPVEILKPPDHALASQGMGWLLIDDIIDTGATVRAIRKLLPKAFFATLYAKANTKDLVDLHLHEAGLNDWIEFPWET